MCNCCKVSESEMILYAMTKDDDCSWAENPIKRLVASGVACLDHEFISLILSMYAFKLNFDSHTNPFFGVSIVPFNTTLNWDKVPNVESPRQ